MKKLFAKVVGLTLVFSLTAAGAVLSAPPIVKTFGGITLGASGDSAIKLFGKPTDISSDFQLPQSVAPWGGITYQLCDGTLLVLSVGKIEPFDAKILQIVAQGKPCAKAAPFNVQGIGLGAKESDIITKFGEPDRQVDNPSQNLKTVAYNASNVAFGLQNGVVVAVSAAYRDQMMVQDLTADGKTTPAQAWMQIADMRARGRELPLARQAFENVLKINPKSVAANLELGTVLLALNDLPNAETALKTVLSLEPNNAEAAYDLGRVALAQSNAQEGRKLIEKAVALDPSSAAAVNELGLLDENENKLDDAAKDFKKAVQLAPTASQPHQNLGRILIKKGNKLGAIDEYSKALVLELRSPMPDTNTVKALQEALAKLRAETATSPNNGASKGSNPSGGSPAKDATPAPATSAKP